MKIGEKTIGNNNPCFIIAEVAQAHDGSLGQAYAFVDALAHTGVDAVKFQVHYAKEESTCRDEWRVKFSRQDDSRYDYWKRMEFTPKQWKELSEYTQSKGMIFLASAFSQKAVELLADIGILAWKIGSGEIDNSILMNSMINTKKPLLISTGMSTYDEIDGLVSSLERKNADFAIFHCVTAYPITDKEVGYNVLGEFKKRYNCPIGFSSHIADPVPVMGAGILGADLLEVHVTFSREMFGPDVSSSLTIDEVKFLVNSIRKIENIKSNSLDKDKKASELSDTRRKFRKSIVAGQKLKRGTVLSIENLAFKKPGDGLAISQIELVLNKKLSKDKEEDEIIVLADLE